MLQDTLGRASAPGTPAASRTLDFIYIGTPKAGSTWLFEALHEHPEARLLASKSSTFFETDNPGPLSDYRKLLERLEPGGSAGEIAHDAYIHANTARRLREAFPDVKIIACLREPGEFVQSMLLWLKTHTNLYGSGAKQITANPYIRDAMDFRARLAPFYALFPPEQIRVMFFDDLAADPRGFYREICSFLDLSPDFEPNVLSRVVNPARPARFAPLTHTVFHLGRLARKIGFGDLVERAKRWPLLEAAIYARRPFEVEPAIRQAAASARASIQTDLDGLERVIGRPVPATWRDD